MRWRSAAAFALLACVALPVSAQSEPRTALLSGRYAEAVDLWEGLVRRGTADGDDVRGLLAAHSRTGDYAAAIAAGEAFIESGHDDAIEALTALGEAYYVVGRRTEAVAAFERAVVAGATDSLTARLHLAIAAFERGDRAEAHQRFDGFIDVYNQGQARTAADLVAVGRACTYLGLADPQLFHDAVRAFDEAITADPNDPAPRLWLGELFLDKYDSTEAGGLIGDALTLDGQWARAHLAESRRLQFEGSGDSMAAVERALELNPRLVPALVHRGTMLLSTGNRAEAAEAARQALAVNARDIAARSLSAAVQYLSGDDDAYASTRAEVQLQDPSSALLLVTVAEQAAQNRLYAEAVEIATAGTEIDPGSSQAWGTLGMNQLRIGEIEEGRASLERAFAGDPFNVWYKNTLDLLDTFVDYRVVETDNFELFLRADRAGLTAPYLEEVAEQAWTELTTKYGYAPPEPIRIEVFERHADFSVRTVGLAGLGALGVAFGPVIAVDAPGVAGLGEFNWGSTLWHEIAHVIAMGVSSSRVPRWFTEGLSVYEEHRARPGWGEHVDPSFLMAYLRGNLLPVSRINEGFFRPRYPAHLGHSYVQASLVHEFIEEEFGFEVIPRLLRAYGEGADDAEAFEQVTEWDLARIDETFDEYVRRRFAGPIEALRPQLAVAAPDPESGARTEMTFDGLQERATADPNDLVAHLQVGNSLLVEGRLDEAEPYLERAAALFPEYAGTDSPHLGLARIRSERGAERLAIESLQTLVNQSDKHLDARLWLAELLEQTGRPADAAATLETVFTIDLDLPDALADAARLHEETANWSGVVRARRALLGLNPTDRAEAQYELARAYSEHGDLSAARRAVLGALEIAPSFEAAQQLLLDLRARRGDT
ncbi:MAG: tetratricopeptide repeat protein [Acidobacteria bacterium]|nr:tetratricopeptide repeat protein [Acidobacteriota bacterium]